MCAYLLYDWKQRNRRDGQTNNERNNRRWKKNCVFFAAFISISWLYFSPSTFSSFIVVIATTEPLLSSQSTNVLGIWTNIEIYILNIFTMTKAKATFIIHNQFLFRPFVLCHQFFSNLSIKMNEGISSSAPTKLYKWFTITAKSWFINTHNSQQTIISHRLSGTD